MEDEFEIEETIYVDAEEKITTVSLGDLGGDCPLSIFMDRLAILRERIPAEYAAIAKCDIEHTLRLSYERPATDAEVEKQIEEDSKWMRQLEDNERRTYERLKAKFEANEPVSEAA